MRLAVPARGDALPGLVGTHPSRAGAPEGMAASGGMGDRTARILTQHLSQQQLPTQLQLQM